MGTKTKHSDAVLRRWRFTDSILSLTVAGSAFLMSDFLETVSDSFYGVAVAVVTAALTIAIFVCTMNYTGSGQGVQRLVAEHGDVFAERWKHIFYTLLGALSVSVAGLLLEIPAGWLGASCAVLGVIIALLDACRAVNLLLQIVQADRVIEYRKKREEHMRDIASRL